MRTLPVAVALLALTASSGCREHAGNRAEPARGLSTETVDYDPPNPVAHLVTIPNVVLNEPSLRPVVLEPLPRLRQGFPIRFEGTLDAAGAPSAVVVLSFYKTTPSNQKTITSELTAVAVLSDDGKSLIYKLEGNAPQTPGTNHVEISVLRTSGIRDNSSGELPPATTSVIAEGVIEIE
jgi:hypothetical protein